jgi:hypothetical protein
MRNAIFEHRSPISQEVSGDTRVLAFHIQSLAIDPVRAP